jgi:hypothetical protein
MSDTCVGSFASTSATAIPAGRICRWIKLRQSHALFSRRTWAKLSHFHFSAGYIIAMGEYRPRRSIRESPRMGLDSIFRTDTEETAAWQDWQLED